MPKVMLVEDDPMTRQLLRILLELEGYQVSPVSFSEQSEILQAIQQEKPSAIVMDVHLQSCSGIDILRNLKDGHGLNSTKILMTSGEDLRRPCLEAGADGFLLKPYMPEDLILWLKEQAH